MFPRFLQLLKQKHCNSLTRKHYTLFLFFLLVCQLVAEPKERLRLIHADELENITGKDGKAIQYLRGNVKFKKGDAIITSNRAYYQQREEIGSLIGSVRMERNTQIMTVDSLIFDSKHDILTGFFNNHFTDGEYDLKSDTLIYFLESDSGVAFGNVYFAQRKQTVTADQLTYKKGEGDAAASYTAIGNVKIHEENRNATCGKSIYNHQNETSILLQNPMVISTGSLGEEEQTLIGSEIHLFYEDEKLKKLIIPDKAHIIYQTKGKIERTIEEGDSTVTKLIEKEFVDEMTGRRLEAYLKDGELDSVRLEEMATTIYHLFSEGSSGEDSVYQGKNIASGDTITLLFASNSSTDNNDLKFINIVGGGRGEFHPDQAVKDVEAPIFYRADTINYNIPKQETTLLNSAKIEYENIQLKSGYILVTWEDNLLHARPLHNEQRDDQQEDFPVLYEKGKNPLVGNSLVYNLSTGRGRVIHGKTKMDDGYYTGEEIRNREKDVFFVHQGIYTTCNLDTNPHFYFESTKMKMITGDKIITKPIILYVGGIPIFGLPLGVFPDQKGRRRSGWIMPAYGETSRQGQYLKGLGYFWAVNDYWDSQFFLDFYDKQGVVFHNQNRYKKRYGFNGGIDFRYNRTIRPDSLGWKDIADLFDPNRPTQIRWSLAWRHSQKLRQNQSFNVNARYYNNNDFNRRLGINRNRRLDQKAVSNATYSKSWPKWGSSISINLSQTRNLMTREKIDPLSIYYEAPTTAGSKLTETTEVIPTLTFRKSQSQLIPSSPSTTKKQWYNNIYWTYNSNLQNKGTGYYESYFSGTKIDSVGVDDSLGITLFDTTNQFSWGEQKRSFDNSWVHNFHLSSPQKLFKYITISPGISFKEEWITKYFDADSVTIDGKVIDKYKREIHGFKSRHTGTMSLGVNTKLYGLFPIKIGPLQVIRHTMTPSISFSYQPDYSKPLFGYDLGYFKTVKDSLDNEHLFDRFSGTLIGGTSKQERRSMSISLQNLFQAKVKRGEKVNKIKLLTWNMNTSYNFAAEEFKLARLRSSIRTTLYKKLNLDISMSHDFYQLDNIDGTLTRVNKIAKNRWGIPTPRLVKMSAATGFQFSGKRIKRETAESTDTTAIDTTTAPEDLSSPLIGVSEKSTQKPSVGSQLWNARVSLRYSTNRFNPKNPVENFWMNTNLTLNLTQNWRIQYSARFDLIEKRMISHDFNIYRDLHCWELSFTWTPSGFGRGFYLRINVKSPSLRDLKLESRGGVWSGPRI